MKTHFTKACIVALLAMTGCQKQDVNDGNLTGSNDRMERGGYGTNCLITHSTDDYYGYDYQFEYNVDGNPSKISEGILEWHPEYDNLKRLKRVSFTGVSYFAYDHVDFSYVGNSSYPERFDYYVSNYQTYGMMDSLNATGLFRYDNKYNLTDILETNYWDSTISFEMHNLYNSQQNVVECRYAEGGVTPDVVFTGHTFDHAPNYFSSNKWTNFILLTPYNPSFQFPFKNLMYCRNNPLEYDWFAVVWVNTTTNIKYSAGGFADTIQYHFVDPISVGDMTISSTSTCDNRPAVPNRPSQRTSGIPLPAAPNYSIHGRNRQ